MDATYRTVRLNQMAPFNSHLSLPTHLTTFKDGEFRFGDDVDDVNLEDGTDVSFGAFVNDSHQPQGLSLYSYEASHDGTPIADADEISARGSFYIFLYNLPVEDDQEIDQEQCKQFSRLCCKWNKRQVLTEEGRRVKLAAKYLCYCFTKSDLPGDFDLVADGGRGHSSGHYSLCVRPDTFVPGRMTTVNGNFDFVVYSEALLACGGWRPHCLHLKAAVEPRSFTEGFDRDVWHTCGLIVLYAGACFEEKHCDTLLDLADKLDRCSYQLLLDELGSDLCTASLDALDALREGALDAHHFDVITTTMDRLQDLLSEAQLAHDTGDVEVYAGGDWAGAEAGEGVAITMEDVLRIFSTFALMPTAFIAHVQAHGLLPTDADGFPREACLRPNFGLMIDLLTRERSCVGLCGPGSFATKWAQLSASAVLNLGELLRSDPLLANYLNSCAICTTHCLVKNSTVTAVETVLESSATSLPTVEQSACHTYCTLFRVSKDLTDSEAAAVCSSLANGVKYLQRKVWGLEGQRIMVVALGGQHNVDLPRIFSDEGAPQEWVDTTMSALAGSMLLRRICTHQHGTLSLVPSAEEKFIVCFSFYESTLLQLKIKKMVANSLRLMSVPFFATDVRIPPVI